MPDDHRAFLAQAIALAAASAAGGGGPFGAVVVRDGRVVATGANEVTRTNDPTAHAEVVAIRRACAALGTFELPGCVLYASCEPCPMCWAAAAWARVDRVYCAATCDDAARAGFDDRRLSDDVARDAARRSPPVDRLGHDRAGEPFAAWAANAARRPY